MASVARGAETLLVYLTADPSAAALIRRAKRAADFFHAECWAVAVSPGPGLEALPEPARLALEKHLNFARNLHLETRVLEGPDPAVELVRFARDRRRDADLSGTRALIAHRPPSAVRFCARTLSSRTSSRKWCVWPKMWK